MTLPNRNPSRIHAIDCRCRGCNAPACSKGRKRESSRFHPFSYVLLLALVFWAAVAWLVWEWAR